MRVEWNLRMLCAQKGIWTAAELERLLQSRLGIRLSHQAVSDLLRGTPKTLSLRLLLALCVTLDCSPNDLLVVDRTESRRAARELADAFERMARLRANGPRGGRRPRRKPAPPPTSI